VGELSNLLLIPLWLLASRYLGPEGFGQYSTAVAFVGLFRLLPDLGMSYASTIAISRERSLASSLIGNLLGFQALLSVVTLALCLSIGGARFEGVIWIAVVVLAVDMLLKGAQFTLRWLLKGFERFDVEAAALLAERVLLLGVGAVVLMLGQGVIAFVLVFAFVRLPAVAGLFAWVHRRILPLRPRAELALWGELLRKGLPFAYAGAVITAFFQIDQVMIEQMRGSLEVGWYSVPARVLEGLTTLPRIIGYALIPTMAALFPHSPGAVTDLYRRGLRYLLLVGLPISAFGMIASEPFMVLLSGEEYRPSAVAARVLLPAALFMFLSNFGETTLACVNRWRTIVAISTVTLVLNVSLNLLWIPEHGYEGAAWSTLLTEFCYFALTAFSLHRYGHRLPWLSLVTRPLLATAAFAAVLWATRGFGLIPSSVAASLVYVASAWALRLWGPEELKTLRELLRRGPAAEAPAPPEPPAA